MADTINIPEEESEYDVTSFSYLKYKAEDELNILEKRIRDEGLILEDLETKKSVTLGELSKTKSTKAESDMASTGGIKLRVK